MRLFGIVIGILVSQSVLARSERYTLDASHTYPSFAISHLGFSIQRGRFDRTHGTIHFDPVTKTGSLAIDVEVASLDSGDEARDKNLKGDQFFDAARYPLIHFQSDTWVFEGEKLLRIEGQLTLRGVTRPLVLRVEHFQCGRNPFLLQQECGAELSGRLKRSDYGMTAYLPKIGDDVDLSIQVEAFRQPELHKPK